MSLKDVAALAGVSVRTVSNVVNGFPHVAPDTRARVQQALDELAYRPNLAARTLRNGRSGLLGLVVPEIDSPYFSELAGLLTEEAERRSWTLLIEQSRGDEERERRLLSGVGRQLVDGLILSPWSLSPADVASRAGATPLVLLGERGAQGRVDYVGVDNVAAARLATEHLLHLGRRRVAAIGLQPQLFNDTARQRLEGYRSALLAAGLAPAAELEVPVESLHRADGANAMAELLAQARPPDAVFCFSDQLALGALRTAAEQGVRVPEQLAVVGFDDIEDGRYAHPSLTTVAPDKQGIAEHAIAALVDRIDTEGAAAPPRSITTGHRLVVRETTAGR